MRQGKGFTLIELLVVIAIIALLLAILTPSLQRARKQVKETLCQSHLRQWGTVFVMYANDNNGDIPSFIDHWSYEQDWELYFEWYRNARGIYCCPMATKPSDTPFGGTFLAWQKLSIKTIPNTYTYGSYGSNYWTTLALPENDPHYEYVWRNADVRGAGNVPVYLDNWYWTGSGDHDPPERDAIPTGEGLEHPFCINRHNGGIKCLFMDWSVRKVGLKQLWTLQWHREFDTTGPWTKAGGVQPEDWPEWMRDFKDY